jgi:antitoxin ParD1/3/4
MQAAKAMGLDFHKMTYNEAMPMSSLNISLPETLKAYVEGQVATGDWGTPSEYIRELIRRDKERRFADLEQKLLHGVKENQLEIAVSEIRKRGIVEPVRRRNRKC